MDFEKFHKESAILINKEINQLLVKWRSEVEKTDESLLFLVDQFINSCAGGKFIRGSLVILGYEIGKKSSVVSRQSSDKTNLKADSEATPEAGAAILKTDSSIFQIAAAYEIFHSAILAHDDVIDQGVKRRGKDSLYQALGGNHNGISQAICLGDAGFFLAAKIISETSFADKVKIVALQWFYQIMVNTVLGQMLDINKGDPQQIAQLKTAQYTISGPLVLGAILAGRCHLEGVKAHLPGELSSLANFGEKLGIAFQIKDDILDSEQNIWGGNNLAEQTAGAYINQAMEILPDITKDNKMSKILEQLAKFLIERSK